MNPYDTINERRINSEQQHRVKMKKFYHEHPFLYHLICDIVDLTVEQTTHVPGTSLYQQIEKQLIEKQKEQKIYLEKYHIEESFFEPHYHCPLCKDSGFLANASRCKCLRELIQLEGKHKYHDLNIEKDTFDAFDETLFSDQKDDDHSSPRQQILEAKQEAMDFVHRFPDTQNIGFAGRTGRGKSFLCHCIMNELIDKGYTVNYYNMINLTRLLRENYSFSKSTETIQTFQELFTCDVLILDNLGTESTESYIDSELCNLLESRETRHKPVVLTTSLSAGELNQQYSERVSARLFNYNWIRLTGKDIRIKK